MSPADCAAPRGDVPRTPSARAEAISPAAPSSASLDGAEMRIESVEDFIAFTHLRHLEYLPGATGLRRGYRIERRTGWVDNAWVRCPAFAVHRRPPGTGKAHAA